MISATEAKTLLKRPPLSEEEIDAQIRLAAMSRSSKCFDREDVTEEMIERLKAQGFDVLVTKVDVILNW